MKYNINYDYTTYLAFLLILRYNNSRKISVNKLKKFPKYLVNLLLDSIDIRMITNVDDFETFIINNPEAFTNNNGYVYLNKNIKVSDLDLIITKYNYPFTDLAIEKIKNTEIIKDLLNLNGIKKKLEKYSENEDEIEELYMQETIDLNQLRVLFNKRYEFYQKLIRLGEQTVIDYEDEINYYLSDPFNETNFPISTENNIINKNDDNMQFLLGDSYLVAYFTNEPLSLFRIYEDITNISLKYCFTDEKIEPNEPLSKFISYTLRTRSQMLFIYGLIRELKNINLESFDEDARFSIETTIKRLLYLIDNDIYSLSDKSILNGRYNLFFNFYKNNYYGDDFEIACSDIINYYGVMAKAFIYEIFEGNSSYMYDENTIKKIAYIKNYYNITKDKQILSLMNRYSDKENFWDYSMYIRNNNIKLERKKE